MARTGPRSGSLDDHCRHAPTSGLCCQHGTSAGRVLLRGSCPILNLNVAVWASACRALRDIAQFLTKISWMRSMMPTLEVL
jgi:hypothetical protein